MKILDIEVISLGLKESKWNDSEGKAVNLFYLNYVVLGEDIVRKVHAGTDYTKRRLEVTNIVRKLPVYYK